jgi:His-Xaa-Ser system radical SAM maturase HxsC
MGKLMPLHLSGTATRCVGLAEDRSVVRLRSLDRAPGKAQSDFVIVRSVAEFKQAVAAGWTSVFVIADDVAHNNSDILGRRLISVPPHFDYLGDGDIIGIRHTSKRFRTLFRKSSKHNSFLVTERCNNYCLMCSQPPKDVDDGWILNEIVDSLPLLEAPLPSLTFTGGEPLTDWQGFVGLLAQCRDRLPLTALQVLTNGRAFSQSAIVDAWAAVKHPDLIAAIPVYAAVDHIHDHVVQANGAFDETILGILKLKDRRQRVEIRVVLHALTAPTIAETCRWIARNLPFVDHVALMGLENTGFAIANDALLWMDPMDYRDPLAEGVDFLSAAGVAVSVYNLPRCVLDPSVWPYAVQSISDWKNGYVDECDRCSEKSRCSGLFTSGRPKLSRGIAAIAV